MTQNPPPLEIAHDDGETLSEHVFRKIQSAIVSGEIAPGSKISEPELARTYGISRGPLREAIHRLEGLRLLESTDLRGALPTLGKPSLWIAGQRDRLVSPVAMQAAAALAPGASDC